MRLTQPDLPPHRREKLEEKKSEDSSEIGCSPYELAWKKVGCSIKSFLFKKKKKKKKKKKNFY